MHIGPKYLEIEITESVAISDIKCTLEVLYKLKELGVSVIMDDFGTGYSRLKYIGEIKKAITSASLYRQLNWWICYRDYLYMSIQGGNFINVSILKFFWI